MLTLNNVTLCCIDTVHQNLAAEALRRSAAQINFAKVVFITDRKEFVQNNWEFHRIKQLNGIADFNRFMLRSLYFHIETDYVLTVQYDGFVLNPEVWTDEFLAYDYIGAPLPHLKDEYAGNGGFSLRSRKLLEALQDDHILTPPVSSNEDFVISAIYRNYLVYNYGLKFAPSSVMSKFSYESGQYAGQIFGFHNLSFLANLYSGRDAEVMIDSLRPYVLKNFQLNYMAVKFEQAKKFHEAAWLLRRIASTQNHDEVKERLARHRAKPELIELFDSCWQKYVINGENP
jgi:hypothetical protein